MSFLKLPSFSNDDQNNNENNIRKYSKHFRGWLLPGGYSILYAILNIVQSTLQLDFAPQN